MEVSLENPESDEQGIYQQLTSKNLMSCRFMPFYTMVSCLEIKIIAWIFLKIEKSFENQKSIVLSFDYWNSMDY